MSQEASNNKIGVPCCHFPNITLEHFISALSIISQEWRLFHNFFSPSVKLINKERIGSKTIKHHDNPKTPHQRILDSPHIHPQIKISLSAQLETLNPFVLRKGMEEKLKLIFNTCTEPPTHPSLR